MRWSAALAPKPLKPPTCLDAGGTWSMTSRGRLMWLVRWKWRNGDGQRRLALSRTQMMQPGSDWKNRGRTSPNPATYRAPAADEFLSNEKTRMRHCVGRRSLSRRTIAQKCCIVQHIVTRYTQAYNNGFSGKSYRRLSNGTLSFSHFLPPVVFDRGSAEPECSVNAIHGFRVGDNIKIKNKYTITI